MTHEIEISFQNTLNHPVTIELFNSAVNNTARNFGMQDGIISLAVSINGERSSYGNLLLATEAEPIVLLDIRHKRLKNWQRAEQDMRVSIIKAFNKPRTIDMHTPIEVTICAKKYINLFLTVSAQQLQKAQPHPTRTKKDVIWNGAMEIFKNMGGKNLLTWPDGTKHKPSYKVIDNKWYGACFIESVKTSMGIKDIFLQTELCQEPETGTWFEVPISAMVIETSDHAIDGQNIPHKKADHVLTYLLIQLVYNTYKK